MFFGPSIAVFGLSLSALCSKQPLNPEGCMSLEFTSESLVRFTEHLKGGPASPLTMELRKHLCTENSYKRLCLKYLLGSVAIFKKVDPECLGVIRDLCKGGKIIYLSDLLDELAKGNSLNTVAQFVVDNSGGRNGVSSFANLVVELIKSDWSAMEELGMELVAVSRGNTAQRSLYRLVQKSMPIEKQYGIICSEDAPTVLLDEIYNFGEFDPRLREIFFLGRCARNPNPQIRNYIASKQHYLQQFLADRLSEDAAALRPPGEGNPDARAWIIIFPFLDVETLVLILPSVCTSWRELHSSILLHSTKIQDMYLRDLRYVELSQIHEIAPWKYCLPDRTRTMKYLGWCIAEGALGKLESTPHSRRELMTFLSIASDAISSLVTKDCASPCDLFLRLFEAIHKFCATDRPVLMKPAFFTDAEYEQAIYRLVYENRWLLVLPEQWNGNGMPKLFGIIKEDEELMKELIAANHGDSMRTSILLLCEQPGGISSKLARLVFAQTALFRRFVEPEHIDPSRYYGLIVEWDMFPEIVIDNYWIPETCTLAVSLILHFKNNPDKIERIVASVAVRVSGLSRDRLEDIRSYYGSILPRLLKDTDCSSPGDADVVQMTVARCGLLVKT